MTKTHFFDFFTDMNIWMNMLLNTMKNVTSNISQFKNKNSPFNSVHITRQIVGMEIWNLCPKKCSTNILKFSSNFTFYDTPFKIRLYVTWIYCSLIHSLVSSLANKLRHQKFLSGVFIDPSNHKGLKSRVLTTIWYFKELTFAVQTNGFSLIASFGTGSNTILAIDITFFNGWVIGAKVAKTTLTGTIKTSRTIREIVFTSCTLTFGTFSVINKYMIRIFGAKRFENRNVTYFADTLAMAMARQRKTMAVFMLKVCV